MKSRITPFQIIYNTTIVKLDIETKKRYSTQTENNTGRKPSTKYLSNKKGVIIGNTVDGTIGL